MPADSAKATHESPFQEMPDRATVDRLQEVWDVVADLKDDKMAEASRSALEMHMRNEIPDEEYGSVCFYLGTRAGQSADFALGVLLHEPTGGKGDFYDGKPKEYWLALHQQLSALEQTLEQRAWLIEEKLQEQGKTCLTKRPEVNAVPAISPEEQALRLRTQITRSATIMRSGGTTRQAAQDDVLHKYGSDVDKDVGMEAPRSASEAFVDLLNAVPGVTLTPDMVARISDSRYTIIGEYSASTTLLAGEGRGNFVDASVAYRNAPDGGPRVSIIRYTNGKGAGLHLDYSSAGDIVGGVVYAEDVDLTNTRFRTSRPTQGFLFDDKGEFFHMGKYEKLNVSGVVGALLNPDTLGKPDDPVAGVSKITSFR